MSRDFAPVSPAIWSSPRFLSLDSDGRLLAIYFITSEHQSSAGCCRIREGYALADLGWESDRYQTALANVVSADLVMHDPATAETYVRRWFQHKGNIPTNKDHAKGCHKIISKIDSDRIREQAEADFMDTEWAQRVFASPANDENPVVAPISDALTRSRLVSGRSRL